MFSVITNIYNNKNYLHRFTDLLKDFFVSGDFKTVWQKEYLQIV
jgi:hypothetical protein